MCTVGISPPCAYVISVPRMDESTLCGHVHYQFKESYASTTRNKSMLYVTIQRELYLSSNLSVGMVSTLPLYQE